MGRGGGLKDGMWASVGALSRASYPAPHSAGLEPEALSGKDLTQVKYAACDADMNSTPPLVPTLHTHTHTHTHRHIVASCPSPPVISLGLSFLIREIGFLLLTLN